MVGVAEVINEKDLSKHDGLHKTKKRLKVCDVFNENKSVLSKIGGDVIQGQFQ